MYLVTFHLCQDLQNTGSLIYCDAASSIFLRDCPCMIKVHKVQTHPMLQVYSPHDLVEQRGCYVTAFFGFTALSVTRSVTTPCEMSGVQF